MDKLQFVKLLRVVCLIAVVHVLLCDGKKKESYKSLYFKLARCARQGSHLCEYVKGSKMEIVKKNSVCDGHNDCLLGDDEANCKCGQLPGVTFGSYDLNTKDNTSTGAQATLRCYPGYELRGSPSVTCQINGSWTMSSGLCTPRDCGTPNPIENGNFTILEGGRAAVLVCATDHKVSLGDGGSPGIICQAGGEWSTPTALCVKEECGMPPNETAPCIKPECGMPLPINNGEYIIQANGLSAALVCNVGYKVKLGAVEGSSPGIVCTDSNVWSLTTATCFKPECGMPPQDDNGEFIIQANGLSAALVCNVGYKVKLGAVEGSSPGIVCTDSNVWSLTTATCFKPVCEEALPSIFLVHENGLCAAIVCPFNSKLSTFGSNVIVCQDDGTWSSPTAFCLLQVCSSPPIIFGGDYNLDAPGNTNIGATATFVCVGQNAGTAPKNIQCFNAEPLPVWAPVSTTTAIVSCL